MFHWTHIGKIFDPQALQPYSWMMEYAQCPTPFLLDANTVRVIISTRPQRGTDGLYVSRPGYVDLLRRDFRRILAISPEPLLDLGDPGSFDEFGIMPSTLVQNGDVAYLYYTGWTRMASVPYTTAIGVAISNDGGRSFVKLGPGPLLGISLDEPYMVNSPIVKVINGEWHMWYVAGKRWIDTEQSPEIVLRLSHATSSDGLSWKRSNRPVITPEFDDECQDLFCPVEIDGSWHAFFAYRRAAGFRTDRDCGYRIGHATSGDLQMWKRDDRTAGISLPESGWNSQMMCSTQFLELDGRRLMFYCGNEFGRGGFGIAELTVT
ncbi:hypothetical protein [Sulfuritalea sp.]|uniref:hypothetical protein n=1 Tax=Sulfuritalea sp. TaxID=2480090 RepID=UPI00286D6C55|nr:hypothetical protein [Sulfuritalea sp.]